MCSIDDVNHEPALGSAEQSRQKQLNTLDAVHEEGDMNSCLNGDTQPLGNCQSDGTVPTGSVTSAVTISAPSSLIDRYILPDAQLARVRDQAEAVAKEYLRAIILIHKASLKSFGVEYPQAFLNLLLTTVRTIETVASHLDEVAGTAVTEHLEPLDILEQDLVRCAMTCKLVSTACPTTPDVPDAASNKDAVNMWAEYQRQHENMVREQVLPLLVYYKHIRFNKMHANRELLNLEYEGFPRRIDDSVTEIGDSKSVASETTLLGLQDDIIKGKDYEISAEREEVGELEPKGCLSGLFSTQRLPKVRTNSSTDKVGYLGKLMDRLTPGKLKAKRIKGRQNRVQALMDKFFLGAQDGSLYTDQTLLKHPLATEVISKRESLERAVSTNNAKFIRFLLARGALVDGAVTQECIALSPLGQAISTSKLEACEALIEAGAKLCTPVKEGQAGDTRDSALNLAVGLERVDFIKLLLKHGAFELDLAGLGDRQVSSLHLAAGEKTSVKALKVLLEHPSVSEQVNLCAGTKLESPLHCAVEAGNFLAVKALLAAGADLESRNLRLCTPLHWAIKHDKTSIATYLIECGADVNAPRVRLETPLKYAVCNENLTIANKLLAYGAEVDASTCERKRTLHAAAAHASPSMVRALLDAGASINARSKYGSTPLYFACQNGRIASAKLLLEHGADTSMGRTSFGSTKERDPMYIAQQNGNLEIVRLLDCWARGQELVLTKTVEDHGDDHTCSWDYWFEKYIVRVYEAELSNSATSH